VQSSNKKLVLRSERMLRHLTGRSAEDVQQALVQANGSVKLAVLLLHGCGLSEAEQALQRSGGQLRDALAQVDKRRH
jgi:N-acetylmuramic acid 6-phosphate etherase